MHLDFGPDFELLTLRRRIPLERGQELARTRRAVDTSMRLRQPDGEGQAADRAHQLQHPSVVVALLPHRVLHPAARLVLGKAPHTKPHHVFHVALGHERDAQRFVLAPRGLLTVDRAVVDQLTFAALSHRERARAAPVAMLQICRAHFPRVLPLLHPLGRPRRDDGPPMRPR